MDLSDWFKGFEKGIARLSSEQRAAFFSECSKNCVDGGVLSIYRKLYKDANGDMDVFFQMANELPGVKSEIVEKGRVYHLLPAIFTSLKVTQTCKVMQITVIRTVATSLS